MSAKLKFRIEFLDESNAAVELKIGAPDATHAYGESLLLASLSLRQMHNIGTNHPVARSLAKALASLRNPAAPMRLLLGTPQLSMERLKSTVRSGVLDAAGNVFSTDIVTLVPMTSREGEKSFAGTLDFDRRRAVFVLRPKGFNAIGEGVNYYAPLSVSVLLNHLSRGRSEDAAYQVGLLRVANACGTAFLSGQVTALSQSSLAVAITVEAISAGAQLTVQ